MDNELNTEPEFPTLNPPKEVDLLSVRITDAYGLIEKLIVVDNDYTALENDRYVIITINGTVYLPFVDAGKVITIKNKGGLDSTVDGNGRNIDGASGLLLPTNTAATFVYNGTEWNEV